MRVNRSARCHCGDSQGTWPLAPNLLQPLDADRRKLSMHQAVAMPQACSCFQWSNQDISVTQKAKLVQQSARIVEPGHAWL